MPGVSGAPPSTTPSTPRGADPVDGLRVVVTEDRSVRRGGRAVLLVIATTSAFLAGGALGWAGGRSSVTPVPAVPSTVPAGATPAPSGSSSGSAASRAPGPPPSPSGRAGVSVRPTLLSDGTWTAGRDMPAGNYRPVAAVNGRCLWTVSRTGTAGSVVVASERPGAGRPTVRVRTGQDLTLQDCGAWRRVR